MKRTNEIVYHCEFCKKKMLGAAAMSLHERMCKRNPKNMHKCFEVCVHCTKVYQDVERPSHYMYALREDNIERDIVFLCAKQPEVKMYSFKLERFESNKFRMFGLTRMPLECDLYEINEKVFTEEGY